MYIHSRHWILDTLDGKLLINATSIFQLPTFSPFLPLQIAFIFLPIASHSLSKYMRGCNVPYFSYGKNKYTIHYKNVILEMQLDTLNNHFKLLNSI